MFVLFPKLSRQVLRCKRTQWHVSLWNAQHIFIYNKITAFVDNRTNPYCDVTINHATLY